MKSDDTHKADDEDWKEQGIYSSLPEWFNALDKDLRERLAPHLWVEELRTGKMVLREHDMWRTLKEVAQELQAQRDERVRLRVDIQHVWDALEAPHPDVPTLAGREGTRILLARAALRRVLEGDA